jgi:hypothetical protein
MFPK